MPNIKCHEYQCRNNMCSHCMIETLSVSNDAYCNDYHQRDKTDVQNCDYEFSFEESSSNEEDEHVICCNKTTCLNNNCGECSTNYIMIDSRNSRARCCQVREK